MDMNWLVDFVCLARTLNFSRAAEERNVTQPAFSRRIRSLETWVGAPLVDRTHYPVLLTPAGIRFLPAAQAATAELTEARQAISATERGNLPLQRIASLHAISVNFLQPRLVALERANPDLKTRVVSDTMSACCQLLEYGGCDFLLVYRHQYVEPIIDQTRFARKDVCSERLVPVALRSEAERRGWALGEDLDVEVPYLSYDPETFLGTVVDRIIGNRRPSLSLRYMDPLAEALKRRAAAGSGIAWLPELSVAREIEEGSLAQLGDKSWTSNMTISAYCAPDTLTDHGVAIWESF